MDIGPLEIRLVQDTRFTRDDVLRFMRSVDDDFVPPIAARVDLDDYVDRLLQKAAVWVASREDVLLGLAACYCNDAIHGIADLSYLAVHKVARGLGIGQSIMHVCLAHARSAQMRVMRTKTPEQNRRVVDFYVGLGFQITGTAPRPDGSRSVLFEAVLRP